VANDGSDTVEFTIPYPPGGRTPLGDAVGEEPEVGLSFSERDATFPRGIQG
jgi:hypothetical protein